jgi:hypothetical protein
VHLHAGPHARHVKDEERSEKGIYKTEIGIYNLASVLQGGIAQLGERLHGMQEVSGSIPLTSTIRTSEVVLRSPVVVVKKTSQSGVRQLE